MKKNKQPKTLKTLKWYTDDIQDEEEVCWLKLGEDYEPTTETLGGVEGTPPTDYRRTVDGVESWYHLKAVTQIITTLSPNIGLNNINKGNLDQWMARMDVLQSLYGHGFKTIITPFPLKAESMMFLNALRDVDPAGETWGDGAADREKYINAINAIPDDYVHREYIHYGDLKEHVGFTTNIENISWLEFCQTFMDVAIPNKVKQMEEQYA